jgi:transposase
VIALSASARSSRDRYAARSRRSVSSWAHSGAAESAKASVIKRERRQATTPALKAALAALLAAHEAVCREFELLEVLLRRAARTHELIGRMMTVPGIGPINAAAFVAVIDTPDRFRNAASVAAYVGLHHVAINQGKSTTRDGSQMRGLDAARLS